MNHSGLFSETSKHLSPLFTFFFISFDKILINLRACSQLIFLLLSFKEDSNIFFLSFWFSNCLKKNGAGVRVLRSPASVFEERFS